MDDALAFIKKSIHCALVITPGKADHDSVWDYPLNAVRETLANALCHRDYGLSYDVQVNVYEDSLRISSPGRLPFDMPLSLLMDPCHASRPRNKIIAQAFFEMGVIERYGGGIKRVKKDCDRNGNSCPEWIDRAGEFVTEYRPRMALEVTEKVTEKVTDKVTEIADLNETEKSILRLIVVNSHVTQVEIAQELGVSRPYVGRLMLVLQAKKVVERVGPDFGGTWRVLVNNSLFEDKGHLNTKDERKDVSK